MATVNLGSIKFNWQGAYNGATAYAVDDVVSYNGSSYICKLASTGNLPTNTTYWDQMSSAGTNGTDLTSTLTTQGDIVYRDASGLARLGAGTAGQLLRSGGAGANVSWTDAPSGVVKQIVFGTTNTGANTTSTSHIASGFSVNITTTSATSKILILHNNHFQVSGGTGRWTVYRDGTTNLASPATDIQSLESVNVHVPCSGWVIDSPGSVGTFSYEIYYRQTNASHTVYFNATGILANLTLIEYEN